MFRKIYLVGCKLRAGMNLAKAVDAMLLLVEMLGLDELEVGWVVKIRCYQDLNLNS